MEAHQTRGTVSGNGTLILHDLPLEAGVHVRVEVCPIDPPLTEAEVLARLKGSVLRYDRPHDPAVDPEEWDAVRGVLGGEG